MLVTTQPTECANQGAPARTIARQSVHRIDILAIGHAPILQINRRIYRALNLLGWRIELAIPNRLPWSTDLNIVEPDHPQDPAIHRLEARGSHIRFWWFKGLTGVLD